MSTYFEATHPRCGFCGAWGERHGDKIQCNNPRCARTSTYVAPPDALIPVIGYKLPSRRRMPRKQPPAPLTQDQFNFDEQEYDDELR